MKTLMNKLTILLMALFVVTTIAAQNGKDIRIKVIRATYSEAKEKINKNGKNRADRCNSCKTKTVV